MALKTGNDKKIENNTPVDLSSLANLMKMVGDITKEADDLELSMTNRLNNNEK